MSSLLVHARLVKGIGIAVRLKTILELGVRREKWFREKGINPNGGERITAKEANRVRALTFLSLAFTDILTIDFEVPQEEVHGA